MVGLSHTQKTSWDLRKGLIPLMAELQQNKTKVHPVMDYRELNHHVDAFIANVDICAAKPCKWQQRGANVSLLDLRRSYFQIRVHETLWPYWTVMIDGKRYCLTCLGFGLNVAPLIMKAIVSAAHVREHLAQFGLKCKDLEWLEESAQVLELAVWMEHGELRWKRGSVVPEVPSVVMRQTVFS